MMAAYEVSVEIGDEYDETGPSSSAADATTEVQRNGEGASHPDGDDKGPILSPPVTLSPDVGPLPTMDPTPLEERGDPSLVTYESAMGETTPDTVFAIAAAERGILEATAQGVSSLPTADSATAGETVPLPVQVEASQSWVEGTDREVARELLVDSYGIHAPSEESDFTMNATASAPRGWFASFCSAVEPGARSSKAKTRTRTNDSRRVISSRFPAMDGDTFEVTLTSLSMTTGRSSSVTERYSGNPLVYVPEGSAQACEQGQGDDNSAASSASGADSRHPPSRTFSNSSAAKPGPHSNDDRSDSPSPPSCNNSATRSTASAYTVASPATGDGSVLSQILINDNKSGTSQNDNKSGTSQKSKNSQLSSNVAILATSVIERLTKIVVREELESKQRSARQRRSLQLQPLPEEAVKETGSVGSSTSQSSSVQLTIAKAERKRSHFEPAAIAILAVVFVFMIIGLATGYGKQANVSSAPNSIARDSPESVTNENLVEPELYTKSKSSKRAETTKAMDSGKEEEDGSTSILELNEEAYMSMNMHQNPKDELTRRLYF